MKSTVIAHTLLVEKCLEMFDAMAAKKDDYKEVNWNHDYFVAIPEVKPDAVAKVMVKTLEMGAVMDEADVRKGVKAQAEVIEQVETDGAIYPATAQKTNAAIDYMLACAGGDKTLAAYTARKASVPAAEPLYLMASVDGGDAEKDCEALMAFKNVATAEAGTGVAAPGWRAPDVLDAAAKSRSEAVRDADVRGVLPKDGSIADYAVIGHMLKSLGEGAIMSTFNTFKGQILDNLLTYLISAVNPGDELAVYGDKLGFRDAVKSRRGHDACRVCGLAKYGREWRLQPAAEWAGERLQNVGPCLYGVCGDEDGAIEAQERIAAKDGRLPALKPSPGLNA